MSGLEFGDAVEIGGDVNVDNFVPTGAILFDLVECFAFVRHGS